MYWFHDFQILGTKECKVDFQGLSCKLLYLSGTNLHVYFFILFFVKLTKTPFFSVDDQNICGSDTCKKKKNIAVPIAASVSSVLVLLSAIIIIIWKLRRNKQSGNPKLYFTEAVKMKGLYLISISI